MSLFNITDLNTVTPETMTDRSSGLAIDFIGPRFLSDDKLTTIHQAIGNMDQAWENLFFLTDGAWSNIQLIEYILRYTGPANVFFTTWSIAADTISALNAWKESGQILSIWAILDQGIRNRKPEILQQATGSFNNLKLIKCHAKVTVIQNESHSIVLMGSANFTRNPRKEVGMIIKNKELAEANIKWILEEFV